MSSDRFSMRGGVLAGLLLLAGCTSSGTTPADEPELKVEPVSPPETQAAKDHEAPAAALAKAPALDASGGFVGLLALPMLTPPVGEKASAEAPLPVYQSPSSGAARVATLTRDGVMRPPTAVCPWKREFATGKRGCEMREVGYEVHALPVYQVAEGGWYLISLNPDNTEGGWLRSDAPFTPLADLVGSDEQITYLTPFWDGRLYRKPGGKSFTPRLPKVGEAKEYPYQVKQMKEYKGKLWIEVGLLDEICTGDKPKEVDHGWVEVFGAGGEPQTWFYSRGC